MTGRSPRVGVVGVGGIGQTHLRAYRDAGNPAVALTDTDGLRAADVAARFGTVAYPDLTTMLAEGDLDAVSVCTPPAAHLPVTLAATAAGVSVLCEKPMARTEAECAAMIEAAVKAGVVLTVGFCHRFQPGIEAMRAALLAGRVGTVLSFRNRFAGHLAGVEHRWFSDPKLAGGGVLTDTSIHSIDLFRYLVGDIAAVRALSATTPTALGPALAVEDTAVLALRSVTGAIGAIEASWRTRPGEAVVQISGTGGALRFDYHTSSLTFTPPEGPPEVLPVEPGDRFTRQAAHFLRCLQTEEKPLVSAADGAEAVAVLTEAYRSARGDAPHPCLQTHRDTSPSLGGLA